MVQLRLSWDQGFVSTKLLEYCIRFLWTLIDWKQKAGKPRFHFFLCTVSPLSEKYRSIAIYTLLELNKQFMERIENCESISRTVMKDREPSAVPFTAPLIHSIWTIGLWQLDVLLFAESLLDKGTSWNLRERVHSSLLHFLPFAIHAAFVFFEQFGCLFSIYMCNELNMNVVILCRDVTIELFMSGDCWAIVLTDTGSR